MQLKDSRRLLLLLAIPLLTLAQQPAANPATSEGATIQALLTEVRQLRLALERSTSVVPRLQLAIARFQTQQERVDRLDRELRAFRSQLASESSNKDRVAASLRLMEDRASQTQDQAARRPIEDAMKSMKAELEQQALREQQQRAQEIDIANQFRTEQAKLEELSDQLNQLDKKMQQQQ
ncbi:MAG TPA: hypothetical protein VGH38_00315 [Bryobacteraceae bacterium]